VAGDFVLYTIGNYTINLQTHEICYKKIPQKIKPLIFKLLLFMLENPQRVLTRDELILKVWNSRFISDSALSAAISVARSALGDSGKQQKYIQTISGHGYRFIGTFSYQEKEEASPNNLFRATNSIRNISKDDKYQLIVNKVNQKPESLTVPDKPSIAIMNILAMKDDPEQQLSAYGLTIEINAGLSRLSHLFVIAELHQRTYQK
jgi:adenylate cyclase